jgi:hypothetical protein
LEIIILLILYLSAPKFINESEGSDLHKLAVTMHDCFGVLEQVGDDANNKTAHHFLPGKVEDPLKILYGNEEKWYKDILYLNKSLLNCTDDLENISENYTYCSKMPNITKCNETFYNWSSPINLQDAYNNYINNYGGTTHMTLIFDVFVIYTLFNQINCRIIDDSLNTFKRITRAKLFCIVTFVELAIQILISQFGNIVFHCVDHGLSGMQWLICLGFSISTILFNFIIKFIPLERFINRFTRGQEQKSAEQATSTIMEMVNQNLRE